MLDAAATSVSGVPGNVHRVKTPGKDATPEERAAYNAYMLDYMNRRYAKHRALGEARLGGKCVGCGATEGLDFHHIDPATKSFTIAKRLGPLSWARLVVEIDKCELRCHACHIDEHRSTAPCGTVQRYWRGCQCEDCRDAHRTYNRLRRPPAAPERPFPHGTRSGYMREGREGLPHCDECKQAHAAYMRERYRRT